MSRMLLCDILEAELRDVNGHSKFLLFCNVVNKFPNIENCGSKIHQSVANMMLSQCLQFKLSTLREYKKNVPLLNYDLEIIKQCVAWKVSNIKLA